MRLAVVRGQAHPSIRSTHNECKGPVGAELGVVRGAEERPRSLPVCVAGSRVAGERPN